MTQLVHEPTRKDHLLDLVLSSFSGVKTGVLPLIADQKLVTATLKLSVPSQVVAGRKVLRYGQADWEWLHDSLADACRCGQVDHGHNTSFGQLLHPFVHPPHQQILSPVGE